MQSRKASTVALLLVGSAYAQTTEYGLRSKIAGVRYAPLAEAARVQGDVHIRLDSGMVFLVSGPPLLAQTAVESAKAIGSLQGATNCDVTYHFVLVDTATMPTPTTVKRGNVFERGILRMFGRKTEKVVLEYKCQERFPPPNIVKVAGAIIEIWINGRTRCIQTEAAAVLARR
jgi:hypothetical protein